VLKRSQYLDGYFRTTVSGRPNPKNIIPDGVKDDIIISNSKFRFPSHTLQQAAAHLFSADASKYLRRSKVSSDSPRTSRYEIRDDAECVRCDFSCCTLLHHFLYNLRRRENSRSYRSSFSSGNARREEIRLGSERSLVVCKRVCVNDQRLEKTDKTNKAPGSNAKEKAKRWA
jgi:hypothetical protein